MGLRFQFFSATAAQWKSNNPTLLLGELGLETDSSKFKIGDGSTAWNDLDYGGFGFTPPTKAYTVAMSIVLG